MHCTKISPEFECQGQRSKFKVTRDKKRKLPSHFPIDNAQYKACAVGRTQQAATDDTTTWPPGGDGLRLWENQRCCLVKLKSLSER